jgi:hypothetical protein
MGDSVVFVGWNRAIPGREAAAAQVFQDVQQYLGGQQAAGGIDSFETVLLGVHGGDLNGFILIRGEYDKLNAMVATKEWLTLVTRSGLAMEGTGVVRGVTGEGVMRWMSVWSGSI